MTVSFVFSRLLFMAKFCKRFMVCPGPDSGP